jgi:tripartite-type tricarboxylate transporter receptor subunit TctC
MRRALARRKPWRALLQGAEPARTTPEQFAALIRSEIPKYAKIVKDSGAKVD